MNRFEPVHLIFGYVEICAENGFPERFVNSCTAEGIPLWDMRKRDNTIYARTTLSGFRKIRLPAKRSSMRVRLVKKHGLPFLINRFTRRTGLVIGCAVTAVVLSVLSGRVWIIEADVADPVSAQEIIQAYSEAGLNVGTSKRTDFNAIQRSVTEKLEDVSWTAVNVSGCTATLKMRKLESPEPALNSTEKSNIVAIKDGQVEIMEPYRGSAAVNVGETVTKGSLLVSGVTVGRTENNIFTPAQGYVVADTLIDVELRTYASAEQLNPKNRKVYSLFILGREVPLGKSRNSECVYRHKSWLYLGGKKMPFGIFYTLYSDFNKEKITVSKAENLLTAITDYSLESYNRTLHAQIKNAEINIEYGSNYVDISGEYNCYENIGKEIPLSIEDGQITETPADVTP